MKLVNWNQRTKRSTLCSDVVHRIKRRPMTYGMGLMVLALLMLPWSSIAQAAEEAKPERLLTMAVEYPGIELDAPDNVGYRFVLLFALIAMVSLTTVYMVGLSISRDLEGVTKPQYVFLMLFTSSGVRFSLTQLVAFFGPLIGLLLGFDMINRERNEGTLSKLLAQPIYRDTVVNGKFLAGGW